MLYAGSMIEALIFDMDGLMIDSEGVYCAAGRQIASRYGKVVSDQTLGRMMGRSPMDSMELYAREVGLPLPAAQLLEMRMGIVAELLATAPPMPGLMDLLDRFEGRLRYAIATSAPRKLVDIVMRNLGLGSRFGHIQTSDDITHGKPHPEIYLKAIERVGSTPAQSVVLEDASNGALAGKRAGAYVIVVPSHHITDQDFSCADYCAADLWDAARHIEQMLNGAGER